LPVFISEGYLLTFRVLFLLVSVSISYSVISSVQLNCLETLVPRYVSRGTAKLCSLAQIVADRNASIGAHLRDGCGSFTVASRIGLQLETTRSGAARISLAL